eukprot:2918555-Pyramimonas_sp.AAC.1
MSMGMICRGWCGAEESGASASPRLTSLSSLSSTRCPSPIAAAPLAAQRRRGNGAHRRAYTEAFKA